MSASPTDTRNNCPEEYSDNEEENPRDLPVVRPPLWMFIVAIVAHVFTWSAGIFVFYVFMRLVVDKLQELIELLVDIQTP